MSVKRGEVSAFFSTEEVNCTVFLQEFLHFFFCMCGSARKLFKRVMLWFNHSTSRMYLKIKDFHPNLIYKREKWEIQCSVTENWVNRCYIHRWKVVQKLNIMLLKDIKDMRKHWRWEVINQHDSSFIQCLHKYAQYLLFWMWTILMVFIKIVTIQIFLLCFGFGAVRCGILAPWSGIKPVPLHGKAKA